MEDHANLLNHEKDGFISARNLASLLGIKTGTLRKWRCERRGPPGFFYLGKTSVFYPRKAVALWLSEKRSATIKPSQANSAGRR